MKHLHGKKYREVRNLVDNKKVYTLEEAMEILLKTSVSKFDASCELHVNLSIDPKHADQMVRSTVSLPHGTGKDVRVIAFVEEDQVKKSLEAGALKAGAQELMDEIEKGFLGFDVAIATPDVMKQLGKLARILGPKGLMPNPKSGTVTNEVVETIKNVKKGQIEFKNDKQGIVHTIFGKVSFGQEKLLENANTLIKALIEAKPSGVKGTYVKTAFMTTTMGPSLQIKL